jgi:hypothetical protein
VANLPQDQAGAQSTSGDPCQVPANRFKRGLRFGKLATGMAAMAINHGAKQLARG